MDTKSEVFDSIEKTKQEFEESFETNTFYNKQTQDKKHLDLILNCLNIKDGMKVLDLGTGTGYLSFPLAERFPNAEIAGLDIVEKALDKNRKRALQERLFNLRFITYDGISFPFEKDEFDVVITRYALHHFPMINDTFQEINRILKPSGTLFLSDPTPNENDTQRFIDAYMQMKKDGHIKFYTLNEWMSIGKKAGLYYNNGFETSIRFPKRRDTALEFNNIVQMYDTVITESYDLKVINDEIYITVNVNNLVFHKKL